MNPNEVLIGDHTPVDHVDLNGGMKGLVPRDYGHHPVGAYAPPSQVKLIPRSEWKDRIAAMTAKKSRERISGGEPGTARPITPGDVMILVRRRGDLLLQLGIHPQAGPGGGGHSALIFPPACSILLFAAPESLTPETV